MSNLSTLAANPRAQRRSTLQAQKQAPALRANNLFTTSSCHKRSFTFIFAMLGVLLISLDKFSAHAMTILGDEFDYPGSDQLVEFSVDQATHTGIFCGNGVLTLSGNKHPILDTILNIEYSTSELSVNIVSQTDKNKMLIRSLWDKKNTQTNSLPPKNNMHIYGNLNIEKLEGQKCVRLVQNESEEKTDVLVQAYIPRCGNAILKFINNPAYLVTQANPFTIYQVGTCVAVERNAAAKVATTQAKTSSNGGCMQLARTKWAGEFLISDIFSAVHPSKNHKLKIELAIGLFKPASAKKLAAANEYAYHDFTTQMTITPPNQASYTTQVEGRCVDVEKEGKRTVSRVDFDGSGISISGSNASKKARFTSLKVFSGTYRLKSDDKLPHYFNRNTENQELTLVERAENFQ